MKQLAGNKGCLSSQVSHCPRYEKYPAQPVGWKLVALSVLADTELTKPRLYLSTDNCIKL